MPSELFSSVSGASATRIRWTLIKKLPQRVAEKMNEQCLSDFNALLEPLALVFYACKDIHVRVCECVRVLTTYGAGCSKLSKGWL